MSSGADVWEQTLKAGFNSMKDVLRCFGYNAEFQLERLNTDLDENRPWVRSITLSAVGSLTNLTSVESCSLPTCSSDTSRDKIVDAYGELSPQRLAGSSEKSLVEEPGSFFSWQNQEKPGVSTVSGDVGHAERAGIRALLKKFKVAIETATFLSEGGEMTSEMQNAVSKAKNLSPEDISIKLVRSVATMKEKLEAAKEALRIAQDPDIALQARLKAKMKATYATRRDVLLEFSAFVENYRRGCLDSAGPGFLTSLVDDFLSCTGEE